jgi:hypothetical protein
LTNCEGLLRLEDGDLVLEYQTKDGVLGILKSNVREARIPRDLLASVTIRTEGLFGFNTKVVINTTRMQPVPGAEIPGMTQGRLMLHVPREYVSAAEKFVADLGLDDSTSSKAARIDTGLD